MNTTSNPHPMTDDELADIKRNWTLTVGDWDRMTPDQKLADIAEFWAQLWANEGNINTIDPNDPVWLDEHYENTEHSE